MPWSSLRSPGTSSTGAISRPTRRCAAGARGCCGSRSATRPTSRSTATSPPSSRPCSPRRAWDVALLQECPPRFAVPLAQACAAEGHRVLTSRNSAGALRAPAGAPEPRPDRLRRGRLQPHPGPRPGHLGGIAERRELTIHEGEPERRAMAFTRTAAGVCVANLHATNDRPQLATEDVLRAARRGDRVGGRLAAPLRRRPQPPPGAGAGRLRAPARRVRARRPRPRPDAIDHLLSRGLEVLDPPAAWPPERRELPLDGRALRLSDHAPVEARFSWPTRQWRGIEIVELTSRDNPVWRRRDGGEKSEQQSEAKNRKPRAKPKAKAKKASAEKADKKPEAKSAPKSD